MNRVHTFRAYRRKWLKKRGKKIFRSLFTYLGSQSLVGDPPVFDATQFPWAMELEKNYEVIRQELQVILELKDSIPFFMNFRRISKKFPRDNIGGPSFSWALERRLNKDGNGARRR